ncbi:MAG: DUF393 domain-containing protein [Phycisphaerae bacterium]|nr:DUF393 domain-containing protein [Phycisphaerae bacterium]
MARPRIIWDNECDLCNRLLNRIIPFLKSDRFDFMPIRDWLESLPPDERRTAQLRDEMRVITGSGAVLGGADAALYIMRRAAWVWPIGVFGAIPGIIQCSRWMYRRLAVWRRTSATACRPRRRELNEPSSPGVGGNHTPGKKRL